jgi:UDP-N-acetyl-D-mannosaminuronic acid dehydrogenase
MDDVFSGRIAVLGLGYIGLPTAAALATRGIDVVGVDVNEATVEAVSRGELPFVEPDLAVVVSGSVGMGRLTATTQTPQADAFIIAVPTPIQSDRTPDVAYIRRAAEMVAPKLRGGEVVILESTSPPGTAMQLSRWLAELRPDLHLPHEADDETAARPRVHVAYCPERVLPGRIMIEIVTNDRVVGGVTPECARLAASVYRVFTQGELLLTDATTAEMTKLVENAYRDVNIAFATALSLICDSLGLDTWDVIAMANRHPRVNILKPGPGVGGHCIAVDPWFIVASAPEVSPLIRTARDVNDSKPAYVASRVEALAADAAPGSGPTSVLCLGLTFKADVDDIRESPAIEVVEHVAAALPDADIQVMDPYVDVMPRQLETLANVRMTSGDGPDGLEKLVSDADVVVLLVEHERFRTLDRGCLRGKSLYDTRGIWR